MKPVLKFFSLMAILCYHMVPCQGQTKVLEVDVCVYGGTSAGVIAAYTAQKLGKTAILIEPGKHVGGMTTGGLGYTDIGNKSAITGISRDFYRKVGQHYGKFEKWTFEPHVAERIFNDYIKRGGYTVLFQRRIREVKKEDNRITEILLEHSAGGTPELVIVKAKMFIDCGYEGDLMARAGVPYSVGRESNSTYGETINGVQVMEGHQFPPGVDPYKVPGRPGSGLLWGVSADSLDATGAGDNKVQAYNFRICLSAEPGNQVAITRPEEYDSTRYELLLRLIKVQSQKRKLNDYMAVDKMPNGKTDINNRGAFSTDMIGMNYGYPEGTYEQRQAIVKAHEIYTKGLLYFLGHDERVPEKLRDEMLMWGYPADEYTDNGNWSPQLYIREARRMIGNYVMTQANCQGKRKVHDGIGLAAYTMDSHNCQRVVINGEVKNEGNVEVGGFGPYPISYGAIIPKEEHASNLLVPVCLSASHIAFGSIRMEPVFMVLAQSAATAAVMAIDENISVQDIHVKKLQTTLRNNPLADGTPPDILVDNENARHIDASSNRWEENSDGGYGRSFLVYDPNDKKLFDAKKEERIETVRFSAGVVPPGAYHLYIYLPRVDKCTDYLAVTVSDGSKVKERFLQPGQLVIEGQTSGEWMSLGQHTIEKGKKPWVELSSKGATGKIVADAVLWVPLNRPGITSSEN